MTREQRWKALVRGDGWVPMMLRKEERIHQLREE